MKGLASCKIYTPGPLARAMVHALGDEPHALWLEPSHGKGAFIEAISALGVRKERIVAVDLDRRTSAADAWAMTERGTDFLRWASETTRRFDRIVGNPPFISIKHLPRRLKRRAASITDFDGKPIGHNANVWCSFVLASIRLLKQGGAIAFVLPSAAEFADYSAAIRNGLRKTFSSLDLYRCNRPLFENVKEGTVVAVARGYQEQPFTIRRQNFQTQKALIHGLLKINARNRHACPSKSVKKHGPVVALETVASVHLGGVTGDVSYFLMTEERRTELALPKKAVIPVISKARHLRSGWVSEDDWKQLKSSGERVWLFCPPKTLAEAPAVKKYLELEVSDGGCNRTAYKVSSRDPWYHTPLPTTPDAFLSGMSQHGPWLCINEMKGLNATNTLYVVTFQNRDRRTWYMWALAFLSTVAQRQIRRIGRRYADGLLKFEPGSLSRLKLPNLRSDTDHKCLYMRAVNSLLEGDRTKARLIADSALASNPTRAAETK